MEITDFFSGIMKIADWFSKIASLLEYVPLFKGKTSIYYGSVDFPIDSNFSGIEKKFAAYYLEVKSWKLFCKKNEQEVFVCIDSNIGQPVLHIPSDIYGPGTITSSISNQELNKTTYKVLIPCLFFNKKIRLIIVSGVTNNSCNQNTCHNYSVYIKCNDANVSYLDRLVFNDHTCRKLN